MTHSQIVEAMADESVPVWGRRDWWPEPYDGMGCFIWIPVDAPGNAPKWQDTEPYYASQADQDATDWVVVTNFETGGIIPPPKYFSDPPFLRLRP